MAASADDELLAILLVNLRNAAATFGEGTPPYESVRTTIEEHVKAMNGNGSKTNLTSTRKSIDDQAPKSAPGSFSLAFRPKPVSK